MINRIFYKVYFSFVLELKIYLIQWYRAEIPNRGAVKLFEMYFLLYYLFNNNLK